MHHGERIVMKALISIEGISKSYRSGAGRFIGAGGDIKALDDVSFQVNRGESVGLVGESGSGKTTLSRLLMMLEQPSAGRILFDGKDISTLSSREVRSLRRRIQIVFQDPYASLNPRMSVHDIIAEPLEVHKDVVETTARARTDRVVELLETVSLGAQHLYRYPHEFSGGQRQRIGIARALAVRPDCLVLDEPTSALDVSVQAQVLNLLSDLQERLGLTYLFISHDLGVIRHICDRIILIRHGRLVEEGLTEAIFTTPSSEYARTLIAAMPDIDPDTPWGP
jgi:ABC-type glutathione transport system ATPase component